MSIVNEIEAARITQDLIPMVFMGGPLNRVELSPTHVNRPTFLALDPTFPNRNDQVEYVRIIYRCRDRYFVFFATQAAQSAIFCRQLEYYCDQYFKKLTAKNSISAEGFLVESTAQVFVNPFAADKHQVNPAPVSPSISTWLPRLLADYEKQAKLNGFTPDISASMVATAFQYDTTGQSPAVAVPDEELIAAIKSIWWKSKSCHVMRTATAKEIIEIVLKSSPRITEQDALPSGYRDKWKRNVMLMWSCVSRHDSCIPSDVLDYMREQLLAKLNSTRLTDKDLAKVKQNQEYFDAKLNKPDSVGG